MRGMPEKENVVDIRSRSMSERNEASDEESFRRNSPEPQFISVI